MDPLSSASAQSQSPVSSSDYQMSVMKKSLEQVQRQGAAQQKLLETLSPSHLGQNLNVFA